MIAEHFVSSWRLNDAQAMQPSTRKPPRVIHPGEQTVGVMTTRPRRGSLIEQQMSAGS